MWIMDGAAIHCHPKIVQVLRSLGLVVIFLPAYSPFFNPIEYLFGLIKKKTKRFYIENSKRDFTLTISDTLQDFKEFSMKKTYLNCGYSSNGFDARIAYNFEMSSIGFE